MVVMEMMYFIGYIDVLIFCGGKGLIVWVLEMVIVLVIEIGVGNCYIYID